jgi:hypothetical protein
MVHAMLGAGFKYDHVQHYGRWASTKAFNTYLRRDFHDPSAPGQAPDPTRGGPVGRPELCRERAPRAALHAAERC